MSAENFRFAVLETARGWWSGDVIFLKSIEKEHDKFTPDIVRDVGKTYLIIRGFTTKKKIAKKSKRKGPVKSKNKNGSVAGISTLLNKRLKEWPATSEKRAKFCADLAKDCSKKFSQKQLASAMTKLIWFARPTDWTMFDRYAADGLGVKSSPATNSKSSPAVNRMCNFYTCLNHYKYKSLLEMMRPVIEEARLDRHWAERILDKYLMLVGPKYPVRKGHLEFYLKGLPQDTQATLENLAKELDGKCKNHKLVEYLDDRQSKAGKP